MALGYSSKLATGSIPIWQGFPEQLAGGFLLANTGLQEGTILPAGSLVVYDEAARTATVLATATAYATAGGSATTYQVAKGGSLKVGDYLASGATGGKAYAITAIDTTSSAVYDTITVGTTIGAVTAGDDLYASTATGATASALPAANGLLYEDVRVEASGVKVSLSAVVRGTVYARRMPLYNANVAALTGLKFILFSQSK